MPDFNYEVAAQRAADLIRGILERAGLGGTSRSGPLSGTYPPRWENQLLDLAEDLYVGSTPTADLVTFPHGTAAYLFDNAGEPQAERTVLAVGRPEAPAQARDATYQHGYPLPELHANRTVDRGHFIPYTSGGLYGPNLFVQDRALNRGWSEQGKKYRALERRAIAEAPNSLMFILSHYIDETDVPGFLNLGSSATPA